MLTHGTRRHEPVIGIRVATLLRKRREIAPLLSRRDAAQALTHLIRTHHRTRRPPPPGFVWDEWMHQSMTFYAPELGPFVDRWRQNAVPFLGRRYENPDFSATLNMSATNVTIFSATVNLPHSGQLIEIVSASCTNCTEGGTFRELETSACPASFYVNRSVAEARATKRARDARVAAASVGLEDGTTHTRTDPRANPIDGREDATRSRAVGSVEEWWRRRDPRPVSPRRSPLDPSAPLPRATTARRNERALLRPRRPRAEMDEAWVKMNGRHSNDEALPDLLIVKLSQPSEHPRAMTTYLDEYATTNFSSSHHAVPYPDGAGGVGVCEFSSAKLKASCSVLRYIALHYIAFITVDGQAQGELQ